jgi:hypothetical protein
MNDAKTRPEQAVQSSVGLQLGPHSRYLDGSQMLTSSLQNPQISSLITGYP